MGHYVYKYVLNGEVLYIGKTDRDLVKRLKQHGRNGCNISSEHWDEINDADIYFCEFADRHMTDLYETELIRRHNPKYNKAKKCQWSGINLPEPVWSLYLSEEPYRQKYEKLLIEYEKVCNENYELKNQERIELFNSELQEEVFALRREQKEQCHKCDSRIRYKKLCDALDHVSRNSELSIDGGMNFDEIITSYKNRCLNEPMLCITKTPFGDIDCIKIIYENDYGFLDFVFHQYGTALKAGSIYTSPDQKTMSNWSVIRCWKCRGGTQYFPLSSVCTQLEDCGVGSCIEDMILNAIHQCKLRG